MGAKLNYLEFPITTKCNMNCKGCSHFIPILDKYDYKYEDVEKDFRRLKELIPEIEIIRIMGGEPFLNKELDKYILLIKKIYPNSSLHIVTNGTYIQNINNELLELIKQNNVYIDISLYPLIQDKYDIISDFLLKNQIKYKISSISYFSKILSNEEVQYDWNKDKYIPCNCIFLSNGKLISCVMADRITNFNNYFNTNFPMDISSSINIHTTKLSGEQIIEKIFTQNTLCKYCVLQEYLTQNVVSDKLTVNWQRYSKISKPKKEDWIIEN